MQSPESVKDLKIVPLLAVINALRGKREFINRSLISRHSRQDFILELDDA